MRSPTDTLAPDETAERDAPPTAFGAPYVFVLLAVEGPDLAAVHRVTQAATVIGRESDADFPLADDAVSKAHARLRVDGPVCTITDLDSRNGTWLNGKRLRPRLSQRLRHLDEIRLGDTRLLVLSGRFRRSERKNAPG